MWLLSTLWWRGNLEDIIMIPGYSEGRERFYYLKLNCNSIEEEKVFWEKCIYIIRHKWKRDYWYVVWWPTTIEPTGIPDCWLWRRYHSIRTRYDCILTEEEALRWYRPCLMKKKMTLMSIVWHSRYCSSVCPLPVKESTAVQYDIKCCCGTVRGSDPFDKLFPSILVLETLLIPAVTEKVKRYVPRTDGWRMEISDVMLKLFWEMILLPGPDDDAMRPVMLPLLILMQMIPVFCNLPSPCLPFVSAMRCDCIGSIVVCIAIVLEKLPLPYDCSLFLCYDVDADTLQLRKYSAGTVRCWRRLRCLFWRVYPAVLYAPFWYTGGVLWMEDQV